MPLHMSPDFTPVSGFIGGVLSWRRSFHGERYRDGVHRPARDLMATPTRERLQPFFALLSGTLFGLGLAVSGMVNPAKVLAFLDVAGAWDATLALVMGGALAVTTPAFRYVLGRGQPWFAPAFALPARTDLDPKLVLGAALFGIGWGLAGLCPGPAVTALITGKASIYAFVAAMIAGFVLHDFRSSIRAA